MAVEWVFSNSSSLSPSPQLPYECTPREVSPLGILRDTITPQQMENLKMLNAFDAAAEEYCDYDGVNGGVRGADRLFDPPFSSPLDDTGEALQYVNLLDNPERFTGKSRQPHPPYPHYPPQATLAARPRRFGVPSTTRTASGD
jgi:hypothetical protein